jgi:hypothetical protein
VQRLADIAHLRPRQSRQYRSLWTPAAGPCHERSGHRSPAHGGNLCQEGVGNWPGDLLCRRAGGTVLLAFLAGAVFRAGAPAWGQAGAPAAVAPVRARARTNELDAGERRPMIGGEERPASRLWLPGRGLLGWVSGVVRPGGVGLTATHSAARAGGGHDHVIRGPGCSVSSPSAAGPAQDDLRARPGWAALPVLSRCRRLGRGRWRGCGVFGVGEQVPGAGEQLAGDRGGGDLLPAPFGDGLVAGRELR